MIVLCIFQNNSCIFWKLPRLALEGAHPSPLFCRHALDPPPLALPPPLAPKSWIRPWHIDRNFVLFTFAPYKLCCTESHDKACTTYLHIWKANTYATYMSLLRLMHDCRHCSYVLWDNAYEVFFNDWCEVFLNNINCSFLLQEYW